MYTLCYIFLFRPWFCMRASLGAIGAALPRGLAALQFRGGGYSGSCLVYCSPFCFRYICPVFYIFSSGFGSACRLDWGLVGAALPRGLAALRLKQGGGLVW